jgi:hypothetical protein
LQPTLTPWEPELCGILVLVQSPKPCSCNISTAPITVKMKGTKHIRKLIICKLSRN